MSLYDKTEKALIELNEVVSTVQDTKQKLHTSADNMTKALDGFVELNKPLYTIVERDLNLEKMVKSSSDDLRSEIASLKGALLRDIEKLSDELKRNTSDFNTSLKEFSDISDQHFNHIHTNAKRSEKKYLKLMTFVVLLIISNLAIASFPLWKFIF